MKHLFAALVIFFSISSCTRTDNSSFSAVPAGTVLVASQVPSSVSIAFHAKYPNASGEIEFEKEDNNTVKVKFFIGSQRWQAFFKVDGTFISESTI
jgi:hypothetical protein